MLLLGFNGATKPPRSRHRTLITGAASGIGRAFATALAGYGDDLILVDRARQPLQKLAAELSKQHNVRSDTVVVDLSHANAAATIQGYCRQHHLRVGALINNAGVGARMPFSRQSRKSIHELINVNIRAVVDLTRTFLPRMLRRGHGIIVNVSSTGAFETMPQWAIYGASKAFVLSYTESLQEELANTGVYVTAVCPGVTTTAFFESAGAKMDEIPAGGQTPEQVVEEALIGIEQRRPLIVTGRGNRVRIAAQRASIRSVLKSIRKQMRNLRLSA